MFPIAFMGMVVLKSTYHYNHSQEDAMEKIRIGGKTFVCLGVLVLVLAGCNLPFASHAVMPGTPVYSQFVMDCNTGDLVEAAEPGELIQPIPGCDSWEINRYERPFNAVAQDEYYPDLDVLYAELGKDGTWFYLNLAVNDANADTGQLGGTYGIEIDWDRDGRGDMLVAVETPGKYAENNDWSVLGVQVWKDSNNDVGNAKPKEPDLPYEGNGYDLLVFNQGDGDDPDAAWARAVLKHSAYVEMAFKVDLLENPEEFVWWVWSDEGVVNPGGFDYHDTYDNQQAGDANDYLPYFPSNQVYELDNTCASLWGLPPDDDPSLCINDPNFAFFQPPDRLLHDCPPLDFDAFMTLFYSTYVGPPLTSAQEHKIYELYKFVLGCGDLSGTPTPTLPDFLTKTPTGTLLTPTETLKTPLDTFTPTPPSRTPTPTLITVTPTSTRYVPCDFDCTCEPEQGENANNCPKDCGKNCGDGVCECFETQYNCPKDCGKPPCECGDGYCDSSCGEDDQRHFCKEDCG